MNGVRRDPEAITEVIEMLKSRMDPDYISESTRIGQSTVLMFKKGLKMLGKKDTEAMTRWTSANQKAVYIIHEILEREAPDLILDVFPDEAKAAEVPPSESTAPAAEAPTQADEVSMRDIEAAIHVAGRLIHEDLADILKRMDELLKSYTTMTQDAVRKANANADNVMLELRIVKDHLTAIRSNTKHKGKK